MTPEDTIAIVLSQRQQVQSLMDMVRTLPEDQDREHLERNKPQQRIMDMTTFWASVPRILNALPSLSDMLKGLPSDQYDSGRESKDDSSWQEFQGSCCLINFRLFLLLFRRFWKGTRLFGVYTTTP
ncbi:hypothetical protein CYMTET_26096 [Cymbomonas tetramitiformis]|uniref:Uncharacterized protein n=1 Tax=Cymbomonas tetramitiformis TaxID=36881 RepID=A0AAE0KY85_9CHLO|nr:hypothetical protein CYMTET_26096 [Cymbomonas tetramitiformis]